MESIKLKTKYIDTEGVYDSTEGKTQDEINAEKYTKPSGGIPKSDLSNAVQASLNLADSAIQQHQSLSAYRTSAVQDTIDAGKVNTADYNPTEKTSAMTNQVGKDVDGTLWTTPVASADVATAVNVWLGNNITQEEGYVIDASLSVTGAAADAKAAGDKLSELDSTAVHNLSNITFPQNGVINYITGERQGASTSKVSDFIPVDGYKSVILTRRACQSESLGGIAFYTDNNENNFLIGYQDIYDSSFSANTSKIDRVFVPPTAKYMRVTWWRNSSVDFLCYGEKADALYPTKSELDNKEQYNLSNTEKYLHYSNGHLLYVDEMKKSSLKIYDSAGNVAIEKPSSDFIKINSGDLLYIIFSDTNSTEYHDISNAKCYVYFFDDGKNIRWDILDYTDQSTGHKNLVTSGYLLSLNGFCFSFSNSQSGYVKIAPATSNGCVAIVWDGEDFGITPTAENEKVDVSTGAETTMPDDGTSSVFIPPFATIALAKPGYTFTGFRSFYSKNRSYEMPYAEQKFPSQVIRTTGFGGAVNGKNINIVRDYDYSTGTHQKGMIPTNLSGQVAIVCPYTFDKKIMIGDTPHSIRHKIDSIMNFEWTPQKNIIKDYIVIVEDNNTMKVPKTEYKAGCTYQGVPYRSSWVEATSVGWHVTKHTFMNAVNDKDSIFYNTPKKARKPGAYYSLVCSSFGTLVGGFPYPMTNYGMMKDKHIYIHKTMEPQIGEVMTNGATHCLVPVSLFVAREDPSKFTIIYAEESGFHTRYASVASGANKFPGVGAAPTYFIEKYSYSVAPENWEENTPYDIDTYTITNGTARPYKGDRSVYTSLENVKINIKKSDATRLYYQRVNVSASHGVPTSTITTSALLGDASYVDILAGATSVSLSEAGVTLDDGAIYAIWASNGNAQSTAPANAETHELTNVEYFEWHDVSKYANGVFTAENGVFRANTSDEFWYAICWGDNYKNPVRPDKTSGSVTIPYQAPQKSLDGNTQAQTSDYSNYADNQYVTKVMTVMAKGTFGAYPLIATKDLDDGESDEPIVEET